MRITRPFLFLFPLLLALAGVAYLLIPPPGPAQAQFTSQREWAGTATGSANALIVTLPNYTTRAPGIVIRFAAASTNTTTATANVNNTGVTTLKRITQNGVADLVGGEIVAGEIIELMFDGTSNYKIMNKRDMVGVPINWRGTAVPLGYLAEDGSCVSRTATATAALFTTIGTTYGVCDGSTTFALPDTRGRADFAPDNQGGGGAAGRLTSGGSGCAATAAGVSCGTQNYTLTGGQLPTFTPSGTISQITPAGSVSQITPSGSVSQITPSGSVSPSSYTPAGTVTSNVNGQGSGLLSLQGSGFNGGPGGSANFVAINVTSSFTGTAQGFSFSGNPTTPSFTGNPTTPTFTGSPVTPTFTGTPVGSSQPYTAIPPLLVSMRAIKL